MTNTNITYHTEQFCSKLLKTELTDEQKQLINDYKLFMDNCYTECVAKKKQSVKKYHTSTKGKARNNLAQKRYYEKNKQRILQKKREKYKKKQLELQKQKENKN